MLSAETIYCSRDDGTVVAAAAVVCDCHAMSCHYRRDLASKVDSICSPPPGYGGGGGGVGGGGGWTACYFDDAATLDDGYFCHICEYSPVLVSASMN